LVRDEAGHPLHAAASVGPGARLDLEFSDGRVGATADADRAAAKVPVAKPLASEPKASAPRRVVKPVGQGSLF
jgi:exodeoxyribonuclease VII large subunit